MLDAASPVPTPTPCPSSLAVFSGGDCGQGTADWVGVQELSPWLWGGERVFPLLVCRTGLREASRETPLPAAPPPLRPSLPLCDEGTLLGGCTGFLGVQCTPVRPHSSTRSDSVPILRTLSPHQDTIPIKTWQPGRPRFALSFLTTASLNTAQHSRPERPFQRRAMDSLSLWRGSLQAPPRPPNCMCLLATPFPLVAWP